VSCSVLATGAVWSLYHAGELVARLTVTDADFPWVSATVEALPGFEPFRPLFDEQSDAIDRGDHDRADAAYYAIREQLTMTYPDGTAVAEFMLHVLDDGTAGWRWADEPFDES
jgi:hypothetical protein